MTLPTPFRLAAASVLSIGWLVNVTNAQAPRFEEVSVHDPSVIRVDGTFYVFGSHLAAAKSHDLIAWTRVAGGVRDVNPLIPNARIELQDALAWAKTGTLWAGCVTQQKDGRFYFYYSACEGNSPRSALGLAVADAVEGPYRNSGILLRSGMWGEQSEDGQTYDGSVHPNAVDPEVFRDATGQPWLVYGSYSGGIFVMKLDDVTGRPIEGQGYGKRIVGGNHSRIEAPFVLHHPETGYFYLFLSFGGLGSTGGYQIRVARSRQPDGPYLDPQGNDMVAARGPAGSFFDDRAIEPYGAKLVGNFQYMLDPAAPTTRPSGYVSPGHNSAYYDAAEKSAFIFFHTRFPGQGEGHRLRVHRLLFNDAGWPLVAPHRYAGETIGPFDKADLTGRFELVQHGRDISKQLNVARSIRLADDGTVSGDLTGTWSESGATSITLTLDNVSYAGQVLRQWDERRGDHVWTFTALSNSGLAIWATKME